MTGAGLSGALVKGVRGAVNRRLRPPGTREGYFERLAPTYDDWWTRTGRMAGSEGRHPGWRAEVEALERTIEALEPARTIDIGCGTGFVTQWLPGLVVGLDTSDAMLEIACKQVPDAIFVRGDVASLPFPDSSFERLFASHIYGHLSKSERRHFLSEARRVASEIVIVESAAQRGGSDGDYQLRGLADGSRWRVFKQPFSAARLVAELGSGEVLLDGEYFVVVRSATA